MRPPEGCMRASNYGGDSKTRSGCIMECDKFKTSEHPRPRSGRSFLDRPGAQGVYLGSCTRPPYIEDGNEEVFVVGQ